MNRLWIDFVKALREVAGIPSQLNDIHQSINQQTEAIRAADESNIQQNKIQAERLENVFTENEKPKTDESAKGDPYYRIQNLIRWATWCAFLAAAIYAGITYCQWRIAHSALIEARDNSTKQYDKLVEQIGELKASNAIAIAANRAWIGYSERQPWDPPESGFQTNRDQFGEYESIQYMWFIKNAGHRPARIERLETTATYWTNSCTETPDYNFFPPHMQRGPMNHRQTSRGIIVPDSIIKSFDNMRVSEKEWKAISEVPSTLRYCVYNRIEYRDVDYPTVLHHTQDCRFLVRIPPNGSIAFPQCPNDYSRSD